MQLSQQSDDSLKDDQDHEFPSLVNESPVPFLASSTRTLVDIPQQATAGTSSGSVSAPSRALPDLPAPRKTQAAAKSTLSNNKLADVTPHSRVPRQLSAFVPATPSQNKILRKDVFGSDDTDLSELSDGSEVDSMKALSQKVAARTDSMAAVTKRVSVLVSSTGAPTKKVAKKRVLDSEDEEMLSNSRKGAKGGSKLGAGDAKKVLPTAVVSDVEDDVPLAPAPLKSKVSQIFLKVTTFLFFSERRASQIFQEEPWTSRRRESGTTRYG